MRLRIHVKTAALNPTTNVRLDLAREGHVQLRVHDVAGRVVRTLIDEPLPAGRHTFAWDGLDHDGRRVSSGIYLLRMNAGDDAATRKMIVLK